MNSLQQDSSDPQDTSYVMHNIVRKSFTETDSILKAGSPYHSTELMWTPTKVLSPLGQVTHSWDGGKYGHHWFQYWLVAWGPFY